MPIILPFKQRTPKLGNNVYLADNAVVIGDVELDDDASVWFGAVLRGDVGAIRVGPRSNVQDLCSVHTTGGVSTTVIGADVTIGHSCVLHGCQIHDRVLIGMGSILLDNVVVGEESVIAAGTLLTARMIIPPRSLVMGRPARVKRELTEDERKMGLTGAEHYLKLSATYRAR